MLRTGQKCFDGSLVTMSTSHLPWPTFSMQVAKPIERDWRDNHDQMKINRHESTVVVWPDPSNMDTQKVDYGR